MSGLYANLLGDSAAATSSATISKAPVVFSKPGAASTAPQDGAAAAAQTKINAGT